MNDAELEKRLVEVEIRAAYQEHTITALNEVVIAQARRIERLELHLRAVAQRLREGALGEASTEPEPPPPHY